jgi:hypothetical protein
MLPIAANVNLSAAAALVSVGGLFSHCIAATTSLIAL